MSQILKPGANRAARADASTFAGLLIAAACIIGGLIFEGGKVADLSQGAAALIVLGGTLGALLVTTPLEILFAALRRSGEVFIVRSQLFGRTLNDLIKCAEVARRSGVASLEGFASVVDDPFFSKALNLAADGTELVQLREMMLLDLDCEQEFAEAEIRVWDSAAGYAPTIGIIGAVLGLIQVMKHLENLDDVGRGIAVSFVATIYGVAAANLIFLPIAGKLRARSRELERLHELMLEGILAIAAGMNPTLIRVKLAPFLQNSREPRTAAPARILPATVPASRGQMASQ